MSATDELRRMLDERGVGYKDRDMFGKHVLHWGEPLRGAMFTDGGEWTELVVENATPAQAIDATLGREMCRRVLYKPTGVLVCSECGAGMPRQLDKYCYLHYCPNCGRKVVDE